MDLTPLSAILTGIGGFGRGLNDIRQREMEQQKLDQDRALREQALALQEASLEQQRADSAAKFIDLGMLSQALGIPLAPELAGQKVPAVLADNVMKMAAAKQEQERARSNEIATAALLMRAKGQPGQPAQALAELQPGEDPEAAAYLPRSLNVPPVPPMDRSDVAAGLSLLGHKDTGLKSLMDVLGYGGTAKKVSNVIERPDGVWGVMNDGTTVKLPDVPGKPDTSKAPHYVDRPDGLYAVSPTGVSKVEGVPGKPDEMTPGRDLVRTAYQMFPGEDVQSSQRRQDYISQQMAKRTGTEEAARIQASAANRPPDNQDIQALQAHNTILASLAQLKQFSPKEMSAYVGLINRPKAEALQVLAGMGLTNADARFAQFQAVMGRLTGTAFGEGGKQLTPFEAKVVFSYTPTGNEPNVEQVVQKVRYLEAFTRAAREARLYLSKTGQGRVDPMQLDQMVQASMVKAGIPVPQEAPGWSGPAETGAESGKIRLRAPDGTVGLFPSGRPIPPGYVKVP